MKRKAAPHSEESLILCESVQTIITEHGRGGLSMMAGRLGMTASALQKRLRRPYTAFDAPTLLAVLNVMAIKGEEASTKINEPEELAQRLAGALWEHSSLRHGLFTPNEFSTICEGAILRELDRINGTTREALSLDANTPAPEEEEAPLPTDL